LQIVLIICMAVLAAADRSPYPPPPRYAPPPPSYREPEYPTEPPKYAYNYNVNDHFTGADFQASESRDGYTTQGEYRVLLPDSRIQIVKYVDRGDGLIAEVTYEGEAKFPEYNPEPKYAPQPPQYAPQPPKYAPPPYGFA
ncbi:cuticle protein 19.8-like, partial [Oratosquilla oratoria]|uniref:cuticle protein 19.8-like n=1 Tax=Oratosquilla oratoria TaxID=337810 RepID=UPI003F7692C2